MELLQENTCFLQKELLAKNDIIKSMIETQKVGLETVVNLDEKPQDQQELANVTYKQQIQQHCQDDKIISINFKQISRRTTIVNFKIRDNSSIYKKNENNNKKMENYNIHCSRNYNILLSSSNINNKKQQQQQLHSHQSKIIFVTNLHQHVTVDDIYKWHGLRCAKYQEATAIFKWTTSVMMRNNCISDCTWFQFSRQYPSS